MGGGRKNATLPWSQLQTPETLLWKTMARARHEMLIAVLLGYFVPEGEKIYLVSKLSICGKPNLLFLGSGEAVLMTGRTRWAEEARQRVPVEQTQPQYRPQ